MTDQSRINQALIEENASLKKKIQELEHLGSEHEQMKEALRESGDDYRSLIQNIQTAVVVHGSDTQILTCNPMAQELLGLTEAQLLGKTAIDKDWYFFNADGTVMDVEDYPVYQVISKRRPLRNFIAGVRQPNKKQENDIWVLINANPVIVNDEIVQVIVTFIDITERKRAEEALRESERKYRNLYLYAHVGLFETGLKDAKIIACNQRYCDLAGFPTVDSAIGMKTLHLYANPSDREEVKLILQEQGYITDHVLQLRNRLTGVIFWAEFSARTNPSREIIEGTIIDISERLRLENELLKMEKLKSLGVLAGGIAHDFNNFLAGIIGNLSLAKLDVQSGHPVSRALGEMEKAALRAKDLTQQLLTFSKGGAPVKQITRIYELVRESAKFALRGSNVRCEFNIDNDLRPADVDDGQIAQVIHNLVINADQAMPDGGAVCIRGLNISLGPGNPYALGPGDYIQLSFRDQGTGIKREYLTKVFDPYFTTKQKGSGLGLAVAYSIIARHDGQMTVDSTPEEGTTFTLFLPASKRTQAADIPEPNGLIVGSGRILVMDDEDFIRKLATTMLQKMGYDVALAEDGQQALALYRKALEAGKPFDAVVLDLTIPGGMGGKETMRRLSELDPNVRAIVSSGYSNDPVMANYASYGFSGAVKKPYLVQEMSQVLNTVFKK